MPLFFWPDSAIRFLRRMLQSGATWYSEAVEVARAHASAAIGIAQSSKALSSRVPGAVICLSCAVSVMANRGEGPERLRLPAGLRRFPALVDFGPQTLPRTS